MSGEHARGGLVGATGAHKRPLLIALGRTAVDPIVGVGIGLFILPRAYRLGRKALRVLLQIAAVEVDLNDVRRRLVHDRMVL